jgi:serine/threonine protein kinase
MTGTRLATYEIIALLGAGGMGEVHRPHDTRLGRDVAVKVLPDDMSSSPERLRDGAESEAALQGLIDLRSLHHDQRWKNLPRQDGIRMALGVLRPRPRSVHAARSSRQ